MSLYDVPSSWRSLGDADDSRACDHCSLTNGYHAWSCPNHPGFTGRFTEYPRRQQDRDARALRRLSAPIVTGCVLHGFDGDRLECPTCIEVGDRDDFLTEVDWL